MKIPKDLAFYLGVESVEGVEIVPTPQGDETPIETPQIEEAPKSISNTTTAKPVSSAKKKPKPQTAQTFEDYVERFLMPHKLDERKATYISRESWERLDFVTRRLGVSGSNVSSLLEQIVREHLSNYTEAIEAWRKL